MAAEKTLSLYVHIPFCVRKCAYCDFLSSPATKAVQSVYVDCLLKEMELKARDYRDYTVVTAFFGGGTPTVLSAEQLKTLLCKLKSCFHFAEDAEISTECNPGSVFGNDAYFKTLREAGFNRLSLGLQSAQNEELKLLGRIHTWEDFLVTFRAAREAGFDNINVDLMSALPGQSMETFRDSLEKVLLLKPEHISAYSLIIEEGTPFYERYGKADEERQKEGADDSGLLPTEEQEREIYHFTGYRLKKAGYEQYEISNYALPGKACRHNQVYWTRDNYLGLGLGASSMVENVRFKNTVELSRYLSYGRLCGPNAKQLCESCAEKSHSAFEKEELEALSKEEQMQEFMFLGLRMLCGVSEAEFEKQFQRPLMEVYGKAVQKYVDWGFLERENGQISFSSPGLDVGNEILADFL